LADIRNLTISDVTEARMLSDAERWNQTEKEWEFLIETPGNICLAAETGGKLIGTATAMIYENKVAWIGMVLVHREHRGKGVSKLLLSNLLKMIDPGIMVKLDATPAGQQVYQKMGFHDEYLIHRLTHPSVSASEWQNKDSNLSELVHLNSISDISDFDRQVFGADRSSLLEFLLKKFPENAWVMKKNNQIRGFAMGRIGSRFCHIGPVSALTNEEAAILIFKLLRQFDGRPVVVDISDQKSELKTRLTAIGFIQERHFMRMYKNEIMPEEVSDYQVLICGPEFG
jgi:GNAT superfamily N-acetyltransferase